jgi:hypothetical protein
MNSPTPKRGAHVMFPLSVAALAAAAWLAPVSSTSIERVYSNALFPPVQRAATSLSNAVPFAILDALAVLVGAWWLGSFASDVRCMSSGGLLRHTARIVLRTVTLAGVAGLAFLAMWGLNYRRVPLSDRLAFDAARSSHEAVLTLGTEAVRRVNALHRAAHAAAVPDPNAIDPALASAFDRTARELGTRWGPTPGRPKSTLLDWYFQRAGVAGMTDPFFLETLVARGLLPVERPLVIAHEWSHLAGITDEGEANFAGWLTCLHGQPEHQYSAWLFLYGEIAGALPSDDARSLAAKLDAGPRADLQAIRDRLLRTVNRRVAEAGWRVYDGYLKANRVEAGAASYAGVVRLAAGVTFTRDWRPVMRDAATSRDVPRQ